MKGGDSEWKWIDGVDGSACDGDRVGTKAIETVDQ